MTGKQRAALRKLAQPLQCVVYIGKEGLTDSLVASVDQVLEARELIKCSVQQNCEYTAREASDELCSLLGAEGIACAGRKFVIYRKSEKNILNQ